MLTYDIVCLTYDIVCPFILRRPAVPITLGPPPILWAYVPNLLNSMRILWASHWASKDWKYGFSAVQILKKWPWQLAILKATSRGPMKCAGPLNGYLIASLYGSGCKRSFFSAMQGAGGGGFSTCSASDPMQTVVA